MVSDALQISQITVLQNMARGSADNTSQLSWQLGQILKATVASAASTDGLTRLNIAGQLITVQTDTSLTAQETLDLKVVQLPTLPQVKALSVPVQQLTQANTLLLVNAPEALVKGWQVDQIVKATSLAQTPLGETLLDIEGRLLNADASQRLNQGQALNLRVLSLGGGILLLQQVEGSNSATAQADAGDAGLVTDTLRAQQSIITPGLRLILPTALQQQLHVGDTLDSQIRQILQPGKVILNINNRAVTALTTLSLEPGQTLKLQVTDLGKPPVLVPVNQIPHTADITNQQLRTLLPQQTGLPELLSNLHLLAETTAQSESVMQRLPCDVGKTLRALAQQILQQLPRSTDPINAQTIKQAVQHSGLFLEQRLEQQLEQVLQQRLEQPLKQQLASNLSQGTPLPSGDLKAALLQLLAILQRQLAATANPAAPNPKMKNNTLTPNSSSPRPPDPPLRDSAPQAQAKVAPSLLQQGDLQRMLGELQRQVSGSLARLQLHQLTSLGAEHHNARVISTEIPFQHGQGTTVFQLRIDEQPSQSNSTERDKVWSITLAFDLDPLGPVHVKLTLGNNIINTTFWTQQSATKEVIDAQLNLLQNNMIKAGLTPGQMVCHQGQPPQPIAHPDRPRFIVDVQA